MLGILVQLIISWLLIRFFEKKNLSVLGFAPTKKRLFDFTLFFLVTAACCTSDFIFKMLIGKQQWILNSNLSAKLLLNGIWWNIKSVLFEELIFRGVLLYILMKRMGVSKAILLSSIAFGIYHWFSHGVIGNFGAMTVTFITTGIMGLVYAYGYTKTLSLYVPCAIHLGWNVTRSVIFSDGPIGDQLFVSVKPIPQVTVGYVLGFIAIFLPMLSAIIINAWLLKRKKQVIVN
ncbi:MAG: CPBP family intramembrane metalloprotease [Chitinophagaceae bacterium]|jgi:uncharacterized protein|nr:CPBP family intramembrane metalloprotease [Chitinophagaceae bacterium]